MPDKWDFDSLNEFISRRIGDLQHRLKEIQLHKDLKNPSYKKEYDELVGALQVNYNLENSSELVPTSSYSNLLRSLIDKEPRPHEDVFNYDDFKNGWRSEIDNKLGSIGEKP